MADNIKVPGSLPVPTSACSPQLKHCTTGAEMAVAVQAVHRLDMDNLDIPVATKKAQTEVLFTFFTCAGYRLS